MPRLGIGSSVSKSSIVTPGILTDNLVLKHMYGAGEVVPVSDGAAYFDGTDDYINCGNGASTNIGDVDMSYSAWIYFKESSPGEYIVSTRNSSVGEFSLYLGTDRKLQFYKGTAGQDKSTTALDVNKWYHVAVVYDQSELDCFYYINGVADGSDTSVTGSVDDASNLYFGFREGGSSSHHYNGYICNVGFWTKSLTQAEIKSIMNKNYAGLTDSEKTNLVSWWNLDSTVTENYTQTSETDDSPSTISGMVLDNHDTTFTEFSITNSDFTSGSGSTITGWTNTNNQWTRVGDTIVSGTTAELIKQTTIPNDVAIKIVVRAKNTTPGSTGTLAIYIGGNNWASYDLTDDFQEYVVQGYQDNDTQLFFYNIDNTNVTIDWVKGYQYDGNMGILV